VLPSHEAAYIAGAENQGLHEAMEKAIQDMKSVQKAEDGSFYYSKVGASHTTHSIAGVAVLSMQLLGHANDSETQKRSGLSQRRHVQMAESAGVAHVRLVLHFPDQVPQGRRHLDGLEQPVCARVHSQPKPRWAWDSPGLALKEGTSGRENMHPVYATTLAALTLQVYYRFLPTYKPIEVEQIDQKSADDVSVEIL
jgi:hypothetical protein